MSEKQEDKIFILLGQMVLGEILACPSSEELGKVNVCLLDVSDVERMRRLKGGSDCKENDHNLKQDILNWAVWLRMHHVDPRWHQGVIKDNSRSGLNIGKWENLTSWKSLANVTTIDNTHLNVAETAEALKDFLGLSK